MPNTEERICTVIIAADLITQWIGTATGSANKDVRDILGRSSSALTFFPSEVEAMCASARRCLPGYNDSTAIDVSAKFVTRIAAFKPGSPGPEPEIPNWSPEGADTDTEDED